MYCFYWNYPIKKQSAERGGFEPPVQFPVRQFMRLRRMVSATHPIKIEKPCILVAGLLFAVRGGLLVPPIVGPRELLRRFEPPALPSVRILFP
jgi:hypothetical protein